MNFLDNWAKRRVMKNMADTSGTTISMSDFDTFLSTFSGNYSGIGEITYFTCLKTLSESLAKMPVHLMDKDKNRITNHDSYTALNIHPNSWQTPLQFFTTLEFCRNHYGNGYAYINRLPNGKLEGLYPLDPRYMSIVVNNTATPTDRQYFYSYTDPIGGQSYYFYPDDIIHVKSWATEKYGMVGKAVREILAEYMAGNKAAQEFLNDLYQRGLRANLAVKYVGDLNEKQVSKMLSGLKKLAGSGTDRVLPVPFGWDVQPLDLKLTDSQFFELRKFTALQVAAAFGVKPNHLNQYDKASYNNSSMQNLSFYVDTLMYNIGCYEQEMNWKLLTTAEQKRGLGFYFNVNMILRGDPSQQAEILNKLVSGGIKRPNEARRMTNDPPDDYGGDLICNAGMQRMKDLGKGGNGNA